MVVFPKNNTIRVSCSVDNTELFDLTENKNEGLFLLGTTELSIMYQVVTQIEDNVTFNKDRSLCSVFYLTRREEFIKEVYANMTCLHLYVYYSASSVYLPLCKLCLLVFEGRG